MKKRTKIIASLGPSTSTGTKLEKMMLAGTDVFRINLSHTSIEDAKTLIDFFINSTKENLYEYLNDGTRVTFKLTGSTDSSKIGNSLPYEDDFGTFKNFPYYFQGSLNGMQLNSEKGITTNSQLGFLRTFSLLEYYKKDLEL